MNNQNNFQPNQASQQPGYQQPPYNLMTQPGIVKSFSGISLILGIITLVFALLAWIVSFVSIASANSNDLQELKNANFIGTFIALLGLLCGIVAIVISI
jgi:uncharacterized membrane protein YphA (DoxX/SURF4 family)